MANIKQYTDQIANAVYGEEVRGSIINALNKVNDDNNSYAQIKSDVVAAKDNVSSQVAAFDQKVANAQSATTALTNATNTANTTKKNLDASVSAANTAKTNVDSSTSKANTAKSNVDAAVSTANQTITNANTAKSNLDSSIKNASTAQSNVQSTINTANATNTTLKDTTSTANTANSNLNNSISSANTAKTNLTNTISGSETERSNLSSVITQATDTQKNLNSAVSTANSALQSLSAEDASALSNLEELRSENFNSQEILSGVADVRAYLGLYDSDVIGVQVDYKNKTFTRLASAKDLSAGTDFDQFEMFGGRKRCNVADDGTINAWYGEDAYKEDGSNGQVMVYQPAFWYLVAPVEYDKQSTGIGYHLRKANYYVSGKARAGFRLHPAFYDANGNEVDHIFFSAFEGSVYDVSAKAYIKDDAQVCDANTDLFCSIAGVKPASGYNQNLTRTSVEQMAQNRGVGWHGDLIKAESANQLLMLIEYAGNLQTLIEKGITDFPWTGLADDNNSSYAVNTGGTSALGNATGHADSSTQQINGQTFTNTVNGKRSVSYRGMENPWGDLWKFVCGVNIWGNGKMNGGQPYICKNFSFSESKNSDNYEAAGFCVTDKSGYISAMGYSTSCDWLFVASECKGDSALPIGDYTYITENLNGYRIALLGSGWSDGLKAGGFYWALNYGVGSRSRNIGGRLVFVPTATAA